MPPLKPLESLREKSNNRSLRSRRRTAAARRKSPRLFCPRLEQLEDRRLLASLPYAAANIEVLQTDTGDTTSSVTVTSTQATPDFSIRAGSTRGDYNIQIGADPTANLTEGILITSIAENGRDNGESGARFATSAIDADGTGLFISVSEAGNGPNSGNEYNTNVSAAYFPFADGWLGGWAGNEVNGGPITSFVASPGIHFGPTALFQQGVDGYGATFDGAIHENGTSDFTSGQVWLDGPASNSPDIHGLIRFDDVIGTNPGQVPAGTTIQSATLSLYTTTASYANSGGPYSVHQLLVPVDDSSNWNDPFGGNGPDETAGEIGPAVDAFTGMGYGERSSVNVTDIVQNWSDGQANYGFNIKPGTSDGWNFATSKHPDVQLRPVLSIVYDNGDAGRLWHEHGTDAGRGQYQLWLNDIDSLTDGVLLTNSGVDENNFAMSQANPDGTWTIFNHDNTANGATYEHDPVAFVFVPNSQDHISGRIRGDGAIEMANGSFSVKTTAGGESLLHIAGHLPSSGALIVSHEGGVSSNTDNIVTYQADGDGWRIQTRDLPGLGLQSVGTESMYSFAFFPFTPDTLPDTQFNAANISVAQHDTGNSTNSVTVTIDQGSGDFVIPHGSNRGDFEIQIGSNRLDDVASGVLITSVRENGRDNGEGGVKFAISMIDGNRPAGTYYIPVSEAPANNEYNIDVAAAYFPYDDNWIGGIARNSAGTNSGPNNLLLGHPGLEIGTHYIDLGGGQSTVDLTSLGIHSQRDGVLLVNGGKNEDNFALSRANSDGTWTIFVKDNAGNASDYEQDYLAFVYVPNATGPSYSTDYISGRVSGQGMARIANGAFTARDIGTGQLYLEIDGYTPEDGVLIVSPAGGEGYNVDNILTYQASGNGWIVQSRDLPQSPPTLQDVTNEDFMSFFFMPFKPKQLDPKGQIPAAEMLVVQNDGANNPWSVSVSVGVNTGDIYAGGRSNRGDYNVTIGPAPQGSSSSPSNLAGGILISSIAENSRDNTGARGPVGSHGISAIERDTGFGGTYFVPIHRAGDQFGGTEFNINFSTAYFPYADGWYGGFARNSAGSNGGARNQFASAHPDLVLDTHFIDLGGGQATVDLRSLGINSQTDGVLLVNHAKNGENNFGLSRANPDGTWSLFIKDGGYPLVGYEQDPIAFVFVPGDDPRYVSGTILGDGSIVAPTRSGNATVTNPSDGVYRLSIPGETPATGVLVVSPEGGESVNFNNTVSYQADGDEWLIHTRNITNNHSLPLEAIPPAEGVANFIFVPKPDVGIGRDGNLLLTNYVADIDNRITISRHGDNVRIHEAATMLTAGLGSIQIDHHTIEMPLASIAGSLVIDTLGGNDTVTVDYTGGDLLDIVYNGGPGGLDGLAVIGDSTQTASYSPDSLVTGNGTVVTSAGTIYFSELEPVDITGFGTATLALPGGDDVLNIENGVDFVSGNTNQALRVSGTSGGVAIESAAFWNNQTLVIDTNVVGGNDTINFASADNAHNNTNLTINTGAGTDHVAVNGGVSFAGTLDITTASLQSTPAGSISTGAELVIDITGPESALAGDLSGAGGLTKDGAATLILSGANSHAGGTTINAGNLIVAHATALGTGTLTLNANGSLTSGSETPPLGFRFADGTSATIGNDIVLPASDMTLGIVAADPDEADNVTVTLSGQISGGSAGSTLRLDSDQSGNHSNTLRLTNAANAYAGTLEIWRGTLALTSDGALGDANNTLRINAGAFNGGLRIDASGVSLAATRTIELVGNEKIDSQGFDVTIAGTLTGGGRLRKIGSGTLAFSSEDSWTHANGLEIQAGQVETVSQTLNSSRTVAIAAGSSLISTGTLKLTAPAASSTMISGPGTLQLQSTSSSFASPDLHHSPAGPGGSWDVTISAPIDLGTHQRWFRGNAHRNDFGQYGTGDFRFSGVISGSGGFVWDGGEVSSNSQGVHQGTLTLASSNTFSGGVDIRRGHVIVDDDGAFNLTTPNAVALSSTAGNSAGLFLFGRSITIGSLSSSGAGSNYIRNGARTVGNGVLADAVLTVQQTSAATFAGVLADSPDDDGAGSSGSYFNLGLVKAGPARLTLSGNQTFTGSTTVRQGELLVDGSLADGVAATDVIVESSGTLGGTGVISGVIQVQSGGDLAPGGSPGILSTSDVSFSPGAEFVVEVEGTGSPGSDHDQLNATGTVDLTDANLVLSGTFVPNPALLQSLVIIENDGSDEVTGNFAGLPEGSQISLNSSLVYISYRGGDGNDVVLYSQPVVNGTPDADVLIVTPLGGGELQLQLNNGPLVTLTEPPNLTFNGWDGDDYLRVHVNGDPLPAGGIFYNGGPEDYVSRLPSSLGDILHVVGTGAETATYTPSATTFGSGQVAVTGGLITFAELEPVDITGMLDVNLSLPNADDVIDIAAGTDAATGQLAALVVSGTSQGVAFEQVHLRNNTNVNIDTTTVAGDDVVTIHSGTDPHGNTNLEIGTGTGNDVVNVPGSLTVAGNLAIVSQQINFTGGTLTGSGETSTIRLVAGSSASTSVSTVDVVAESLLVEAATGIDLDTSAATLAATNSTSGNLQIENLGTGLLTIGTIAGTAGIENAAPGGTVSVATAGSLTVTENVTAAGEVMLAAESHLTVTDGDTVESQTVSVELSAGNNLTLQDSSTVVAETEIALLGGQAGAGSSISLLGSLDADEEAGNITVTGGPGIDTITLNPGVGHTADGMSIDGGGADDAYHIWLGRLNGAADAVHIEDSGTTDGDEATVYGTPEVNSLYVHNNVDDQDSAQTGGFVDLDLDTPQQRVNYTETLESLTVDGLAELDSFFVEPSQTAEIWIKGNAPGFGEAGAPGGTPAGVGDTLDYDSLGNTFDLVCGTIYTDDADGDPSRFLPIRYTGIENMPLTPLPDPEDSANTRRFDFDRGAGAVTQDGYTSVPLGTVYDPDGTEGQRFGWVGSAPSGAFDRGAFGSTFTDSLRDGHWNQDGGSHTFRTDVTNGWYLVSVKTGDLNFARDRLRISHGDTGKVLADQVASAAGQIAELTFVMLVDDGTLDLHFQNTGGDPYMAINAIDIQPGQILTFGSPESLNLSTPQTQPLTADGVSETTIEVYGATPEALVTIDPQLDTDGDHASDGSVQIVWPADADPFIAGHQVEADINGYLAYTIVHPSAAGTMFVRYAEVSGAQSSCAGLTFEAPATRRFDFNTATSPTQTPVASADDSSGYTGVLPSELTSPVVGYGWVTPCRASTAGRWPVRAIPTCCATGRGVRRRATSVSSCRPGRTTM
jgi:autotransporter-associated beta strand protein